MEQMPDNKKPATVTPEEKKKISDMVKYLARAVSQSHDFGITHPLALQPIEDSFKILSALMQEHNHVALYIAEKKIRYIDTAIEERNPVVDKLVTLFTAAKVVSVEFDKGFSREDFISFLGVFAMRSQDIIAQGGAEALFKQKNITHFKLNPIKYELIGMDKRVISGKSDMSDEDLTRELDKIFGKPNDGSALAEPEKPKESPEENPEDKLIALIDTALQENTQQSAFVEKLNQDPLEEVHSITEAVHILNKVGGEKAKTIISGVTKKLDLLRDNLYANLIENKDDEAAKLLYRSCAVLGKELSKQIKTIQVKEELKGALEGMESVLNMIMDQTEANKMLSGFLKGPMSLKKKASFLKSLSARVKLSVDFESMIKKLLILKGMPEDEVRILLEQKAEILEQADKEKQVDLSQEFKPLLQAISQDQGNVESVTAQLNEIVSKTLDAQLKTATKKIRAENEKLTSHAKALSAAFADVAQGIIIFQEDGRVVFSNKACANILQAEVNKKLDATLISLLDKWLADASWEQISQGIQINEAQKENLSKIISCVKAVQRDEKGKLSAVIFNK
ncbi:MAG: hypothetical protein MUF05_02885 [Candidatus Omnitrophica bacterium]|jgi:PAS domain-containing protein|nr:hypothetical protein [Candidatus Omnitrophota bacterium]